MPNEIEKLPQILSDLTIIGIGRNFEGAQKSFKIFIEIYETESKKVWDRIDHEIVITP